MTNRYPRRVCVVVTARPSYSRIYSVLQAIKKHPQMELQLVVGASALLDRYGTTISYIERDGFEVAAKVHMVLEGENPTTMAKTTGLGLLELPTVLDSLKPEVVVTIADRYETIATAIAASYMNIPVAHVQGGEVTGSIDEKVRHAVTKLSDLHFVATEGASERVIRMGENPDTVFVTGCPSVDLAFRILADSTLKHDVFEQYGGVGSELDLSNDYLVVLQHPVTTEYDLAKEHVFETLYAIKQLHIPTLWFWPNVDAGSDGTSRGIRIFRELEHPTNIHFFKNFMPLDFLKLIYNCSCLVGNSSVGIREASFLGIPVVNIGTRQSGRERGKNVLDVDYDREQIMRAVNEHFQHGHYDKDVLYGNGNAGESIANLLATIPLKFEKRLMY